MKSIILYLVMFLQFPLFILDMVKLLYLTLTGLVFGIIFKGDVGRYILNNYIGIDQSVNAEAGGSPDETCSGRLGRYQNTVWIAKIICKMLNLIDKNHCADCFEPDEELKDEVIR